MLNLLSGVIRNDPPRYGGYVLNGVYTPTPVVDPATFGKATFPMPAYMLPNVKRVDTPVNKTDPHYALGLAPGAARTRPGTARWISPTTPMSP